MLRAGSLAVIALIAFAANSVLARMALGAEDISASGYTGVRLASGAATLTVLLYLRMRRGSQPGTTIGGSWPGAATLLGYALAFSIAYLMLGAATGALILFATVQIGMLAFAIVHGDRPAVLEWIGFVLAFCCLVYLVSPGLVAPSLLGAAAMVVAGICWAAYSILGQSSRAPLVDTAGNFTRCVPAAVLLILIGELHMSSPIALGYAIASGAVASGVGYAIWYSVLPTLPRSSAAFMQLAVPALAAAGGVLFVGEQVTDRLIISSVGIMGGVGLALFASSRRRAALAGAQES
jgi:drug/metabolite transporter (DMT)-like permease